MNKKGQKKYVTKEIQPWEVKYGQILFSGNTYVKAYALFKPLLVQGTTFTFQYFWGKQERNFVHDSSKRIIRLACKQFFGKLESGTLLKFSMETKNVVCLTHYKTKKPGNVAVFTPSQERKIFEKAEILGQMILAMRKIYDAAKPDQKKLMETMVGAAIFYFPRSEKLWTNKISQKALDHLKSYGTTKGLTKDHQYPRKEAGRELLTGQSGSSENITVEVCDLYRNKYGRHNWVTKSENRKLVPFQKEGIFITPEGAYKKAAITLLKLSINEFKALHK
jgi:hypothetical protein